jgi:hypothetical protein
MGWVAVAGMVISGVLAAKQQQDAGAQASYQASIAQNNQIIANQKAEDAIARGELEERQHRVQIAQLMGKQRAGAASRGVIVDAGSALDITLDTAAIGELEALTIRDNAEREALGFRQQADMFGSDAAFLGSTGKSLSSGAALAGFSSMLTSAAPVANKWITTNAATVG